MTSINPEREKPERVLANFLSSISRRWSGPHRCAFPPTTRSRIKAAHGESPACSSDKARPSSVSSTENGEVDCLRRGVPTAFRALSHTSMAQAIVCENSGTFTAEMSESQERIVQRCHFILRACLGVGSKFRTPSPSYTKARDASRAGNKALPRLA
jgi:hypothetical protein